MLKVTKEELSDYLICVTFQRHDFVRYDGLARNDKRLRDIEALRSLKRAMIDGSSPDRVPL